MGAPRVSVILTSFNHEQYIQEAIDSVLDQTFTDFELIIWDDASSDNSWDLINQYSDPRIKAFRNDARKRAIWGINKAVSAIASAEYIAIHHSDDLWGPEKLRKQVIFLDTHPDIGAVFTWAQVIDENGVELAESWFNQENKIQWQWLNQLFLEENHLNHPSVLIRRECYQNVGAYRYGLAQTGDAEMWSRVLVKFPIYVIQERLTKHRLFSNKSNTSGTRIEVAIRANNEWNVLRENYLSIASFEDIVATFPGLERFKNPEGFDNRFLLAMACLYECKQRSAWELGLRWLFDLLNDETSRTKIEKLYSFSYPDFIRLTEEFDVYALRSFAERDGQIATLAQSVAERDQSVAERNRQIAVLTQSVAERDKSVAERDGRLEELGRIVAERDLLISAIRQSTSWMITRPLRRLGVIARLIINRPAELSPYLGQIARRIYGSRREENRRSRFDSERISPALSENSTPQAPICCVVIPTKNGGALFLKVLGALARQTIWDRTELIVVDSGSQDDTVFFAKRAGARVFEIPPEEFNHGATRDYGISKANSEYIILMVQDAVPLDSGMLERLLSALKEERVAGVYARQIPRPDADVLTQRNLNMWLTGRTEREVRSIPNEEWYEALAPMQKYRFCNFDNVCSAINRSIWLDEKFGQVNFGEDIDWAERVLKRGYKIVYDPSAAAIHSHDRPMTYEYKRAYVCHRKLYSMFGLHLVPSLKGIWKSWFHASIADAVYILQHENRLLPKAQMILKTPILNFLSALGQYRAGRDEIQGVSNSVRGV